MVTMRSFVPIRGCKALLCLTVYSILALVQLSVRAAGPTVANPILFVTQTPAPDESNGSVSNVIVSVASALGNHLGDTAHAPRGGDLYIYYTDGTWTNLTRLAGLSGVGNPAVP